MVRLRFSRFLVPGLLLLAAAGALFAGGPATSRKAQLEFGIDMAKRGLWNEALFRFENARKLEPSNASVLNNLAVCYEAAGRFEDALATYRQALQIAPGNNALKQNYSRFAEFYQGYRPKKPAETKPAPGESAPPPAVPGTNPPDEAPEATPGDGEEPPVVEPPIGESSKPPSAVAPFRGGR
jgi:tetratricopeptide (TPR) repeat protein